MNDALCFSNLPQIGPNTNLEFSDDSFIGGSWIPLSVFPNDTIPTTTAFDQKNKNHARRVRSYAW